MDTSMKTKSSSMTTAKTSDMVMFNFRRPIRARKISGALWLVEAYDAANDVWIWQTESTEAEDALDEARRMSMGLA